MYTGSIPYPDWYKIEKETQKTINKLYEIKDLDFYLKSPDEYIRRLAIIRISEIKPRDSINVLKNIVDEPCESLPNKELAAWAIKAISLKWNMELFISNKLISKFSGNEKLEELTKVIILDSLPSIKHEFSSEIFSRELKLENSTVKQYGDISFDMPFTFKTWFISYCKYFFTNFTNMILKLPVIIVSLLKTFMNKYSKALLFNGFKLLKNLFSSIVYRLKHKTNYKKAYKTSYFKSPTNTVKASTSIKNFLIGILYIIFFPVRILIKHKLLFFCAVAASYCLLTLTTPGKILTYKYTGMDISEIQQNALYSAKDFVVYALDEAKSLVGIESKDSSEVVTEDPVVSTSTTLYKVIAKEGLNLRASPNPTAAKTIKDTLKYDTVVQFDGVSKKDSSGRIWYFITTPEGNSGWVNSRWLKIGG